MNEQQSTFIDTKAQIVALRSAIANHRKEREVGKKHDCQQWRGNRANERRLSFLTGEVFYGVRVFDLDIGEVSGVEAMGASREVANNVVCAMEISLEPGRKIKITGMSGDVRLALKLGVGQQITLEVNDIEMMHKAEVTFCVFLTAAQAEAWAERQKQLGHKER